MGKMMILLIVVTFPSPTTGEESALDGAEQAAPPGVVLVDAGAARRDEEAVGSISQDTHVLAGSVVIVLFVHPALQTIFSMRFPVVFRSESRGVFLVVLVVWCCLPRKICTMFLLLLSCSRPITHGDDALASSRQLLQKCSSATSSGRTSPFSGCASSPIHQNTRICLGVSHISQLSRHMSFSQPSARAQHCHPSLQLNVESGFRHIFEACGNMVIFPHLCHHTPKDLAVAQHFQDRCA